MIAVTPITQGFHLAIIAIAVLYASPFLRAQQTRNPSASVTVVPTSNTQPSSEDILELMRRMDENDQSMIRNTEEIKKTNESLNSIKTTIDQINSNLSNNSQGNASKINNPALSTPPQINTVMPNPANYNGNYQMMGNMMGGGNNMPLYAPNFMAAPIAINQSLSTYNQINPSQAYRCFNLRRP